ncbi:flagellar basal body-associated FliL family protein [Aureimonas populi]|uniref:Flagellar protein FliL n=1 Tax=Aureimonas populi TaxID=1701758 RepID=A0ABW5CGG5_9HYPH|nr:flagellar basal body-associated FliL family protein [Aureimonas populi]
MADENALAFDPGQLIAGEGGARPARMPIILGVAAATAIAVVAGGATGFLMSEMRQPDAAGAEEGGEAGEPAAPAAYGAGLGPLVIVPVEPIVTNISSPPSTILRVEASLVLKAEQAGDTDVLAAQVSADTLAFARSLDLAQIEGSRGLLHLREDLKQRAMQRSPAVADYIIHSLIAQ